jgi:hypothetical protein
VCEKISVGRYGSPGVVRSEETLYSVLIAPADLKDDQIVITVMTHAEKKGMSVLRQNASDDEFRRIITNRVKDKSKQRFHGVVAISCASVRALAATASGDQRQVGDRLYCILDTDMHHLPNHADIFATVPRPHQTKTPKAAWRSERAKLMDLLQRNFSSAQTFRGGVLNVSDRSPS